jgi:hypothetical protein
MESWKNWDVQQTVSMRAGLSQAHSAVPQHSAGSERAAAKMEEGCMDRKASRK